MKIRSQLLKVLTVVSVILLVLFPSNSWAGDRSTYSPTINKVTLQEDGSLKIVFRTTPETMWFCPGANTRKVEDGLQLSFVRASFRKRPKVDLPAKAVKKGAFDKFITVPAPVSTVFVKNGAKMVKIHPEE